MKTDNNRCLDRSGERRLEQCRPNTSFRCNTGLLTERTDLRETLLRSLCSIHLQLRHVRSFNLIKAAIKKRACDVAIIDVARRDIWPSMVFAEFDMLAADFPVIMLCNEREQALNYIRQAENVVDVFTYEVAADLRFSSVVQAAQLRGEARSPIDAVQDLDQVPLFAA